MQPNSITLTVDENNDGVSTPDVDHVYSREDYFNSRSVYHHADHEPDMRNMLGFYRTPAKATGNSRGKNRSSFKFTVDVVVPGRDGTDIVETMYFEVNASIPLGVTEADELRERQKCIALLDNDNVMGPLNHTLSI